MTMQEAETLAEMFPCLWHLPAQVTMSEGYGG